METRRQLGRSERDSLYDHLVHAFGPEIELHVTHFDICTYYPWENERERDSPAERGLNRDRCPNLSTFAELSMESWS